MESRPALNPNNLQATAGRRDEWSEGAVACLLDAYESKWELRNRAKLKARDWENVACRVTGRAGGARSSKTSVQCKNKIESMKKRYRLESTAVAAGGGGGSSRWPLFGRVQRLMTWKNDSGGIVGLEGLPAAVAVPSGGATAVNGGVGAAKEPSEGKGKNKEERQSQMEAEHSKPINDACKEREDNESKKKKKKMLEREEGYGFEIMDSIQSLAEAALKVEQLRMEAIREVDKIWAQAEAKKGELDLKRTEIIANNQLKIARLLYKSNG